MDTRPIGIFDSGLGGLTAVRELRRLLPNEDLLYFGDTGRVPYGTRAPETLHRFIMQDIRFLQRYDCKLILVACGTASSNITPEIAAKIKPLYSGVVPPAAQAAAVITRNRRVGVIGTAATVRAGALERALRELDPQIEVFQAACPLFVPLIENGWILPDNAVTTQVAEHYLRPLADQGIDTLVLACTHFPLLRETIGRIMGAQVQLVDSGQQLARWARYALEKNDLCNLEGGRCAYFVSDRPDGFIQTAEQFLGESIREDVQYVDLDSLAAE